MMKTMKIVMMAFLLMIALGSTASAAELQKLQDRVGTDKFAHAGCSYVLCDIGDRMFPKAQKWQIDATVLAIGVEKEMTDDHFDKHDLMADVAGIALHRWLHYEVKF